MNTLTDRFIKIFDINVNSSYCANTAILYKNNLNDYKLVMHLSDNNHVYVPMSDNTIVNLLIDDVDFTSNIEIYNPNMGCIIIYMSDSMQPSDISDSEYKLNLTLSVVGLPGIDNKIFEIPITIIPGSDFDKDEFRKSKIESNYVTASKHSSSKHPKFKKLINYMF